MQMDQTHTLCLVFRMRKFLSITLLLTLVGCSATPSDIGVHSSSVSAETCITDANLPLSNWHTLQKEGMGFEIQYPGYIASEAEDAVRLENYRHCPETTYGLEPGQYYLEVTFVSAMGYASCTDKNLTKNPEKVELAGGGQGWKWSYKREDTIGDVGGNVYLLCMKGPKGDVLFSAKENSETGALVNVILNSIRLFSTQ